MISTHNIYEVLSVLNLKHKGTNGAWIQISCPNPMHQDKDPSAGININTGICHCFGCGYDRHLTGILIDNLSISYKEACEMLDIQKNITPHPTKNLEKIKTEDKTLHQSNVVKSYRGFDTTPFDPEEYEYTKVRGFSKEFCDQFNIEYCPEGYYGGYMIIPVVSKLTNTDTFEARKIVDLPENENLNKVLYPKGNKINSTLFNYDNLDFNKDLIICEGIGSIPKIYNLMSQNVTSIFGANVTVDQISLLRNFTKKIIVLSDFDRASHMNINKMSKYLMNVCVFDVETDDKLDSFTWDLMNADVITSARYLLDVLYGK